MKIVKAMSLMAVGMGVYMMYDKYGKKIVNKMSKKMDKLASKATDKIEDLL